MQDILLTILETEEQKYLDKKRKAWKFQVFATKIYPPLFLLRSLLR